MRAAAVGLVFFSAGFLPSLAAGQIVLKPASGEAAKLRAKSLEFDAEIGGAVASETFDYVFANEGQFRGDAEFLIQVPQGGVVTGFAYWYEGEKVVARVTEKERARDIYAAITTRQRDPALIEMVGKNLFRVKVFPVQGNADLRVELKMVQALPSGPDGPTLAVPLKGLGKLGTLGVNVRADGPVGSNLSSGPGGAKREKRLQYRVENATAPDLKVTALRARRPFTADLRAARSGGTGGFFALTLTAAGGMERPRLLFAGATVKDVLGLPARMAPGRAYTVVGRYEGARPGARFFLAGGGGARFSQALDFPAAAEPNGPAAKLWAWARIGASKDRKEIVALSVRHTVPSRYTSWIAIPKAERARFAQEIAMGDLRRFGRRMAATVRRSGALSPAGRREIAAYRAKAKGLGVDPQRVYDEGLAGYAQGLGERWKREADRRGEGTALARRLEAELRLLATVGAGGGGTYTQYHADRAYRLAPAVYADRMAGRTDAAARARARAFARHARAASGSASGPEGEANFLSDSGYRDAFARAERIARAEREGREVAAAERRELARRERAVSRREGTLLKGARRELALAAVDATNTKIQSEMDLPRPSVARLRELDAERRRERLDAGDRWRFETPRWIFERRYEAVLEGIAAGTKTAEDAAREREAFKGYAEALGDRRPKGAGFDPAATFTRVASRFAAEVRERELAARRNRGEIAEAQAAVERLRAVGDVAAAREIARERGGWRGEPDQAVRNAYVDARHAEGSDGEGRGADDLEARLRAEGTGRGTEYLKDRAGLLRALTALDALDGIEAGRALTSEEARAKADLERRAKELHARMGDPIVASDAPRDALGLVAEMPDGSVVPMAWNGVSGRWEARFDIPAGTPDGGFAVGWRGHLADGTPVAGRAEFLVDTKAPSVSLAREGSLVVATTDADVARVTLFASDGSRRGMERHGPGRFALTGVPEGPLRAVATDRAHNRSDMAAPGPLPPLSEAVDPAMNVQALAPFGDRVWVSTLDAGGRFEGEAAVPEVGPWPRQAAAFGPSLSRLAVRTAPGEVVVFDGGGWAPVARGATTVAADGEALLVGTVGGWTEIGADGAKRTVRPPALAGVVTTCLLARGGTLWIGTQGRGLYEWDRGSGVGRWHDERGGLTDDWITALGVDEGGRVVAGTFVGGALALEGGRWTVVPGTEGGCVTAVLGADVATRRGVVRGGAVVVPGEAQALARGLFGMRGRIERGR